VIIFQVTIFQVIIFQVIIFYHNREIPEKSASKNLVPAFIKESHFGTASRCLSDALHISLQLGLFRADGPKLQNRPQQSQSLGNPTSH
jgi:hypothetical protein